MKKLTSLIPLTILTALLASGCATVTKGPNQRVEIDSTPAGAAVRVNGEWIGNTPTSANLSRKRAHTVEVEKPYYDSETVTLLTVPNEAADAVVRFGIDEVTGAHADLSPDEVDVELDPEILPDEVGENPVSELATKILELDDKLAAGEIQADEHSYITKRLVEFYQQ